MHTQYLDELARQSLQLCGTALVRGLASRIDKRRQVHYPDPQIARLDFRDLSPHTG